MENRLSLNNKVAIITGASKGIGAAIAKKLAEQGASVVVSSRSQAAVDEVAQSIKDNNGKSIGIECHVGKQEHLSNLVEKTVAEYGRIDILINNAATNPTFGGLAEADLAVFDKIMNVNVKACMLLSNLCYPYMKKSEGGSIINISSVEGVRPSRGLGMYSISKSALIALTKSQAMEWGSDGIRSNVICPGLIKTKFSKALWSNEQLLSQFEMHIPLGRMASPDEISDLALLLASDASSYITGSVYNADGGYLI